MSTAPTSSHRSHPAPVIAIIGGGFSGTLVAAHLLRRARRPLRVVLFERAERVGGGVAYGSAGGEHLLNVPAARMSAWPDAPDDFLLWARGRPGLAAVAPTDFLPRRLYGVYLEEVLRAAQDDAGAGVTLETRHAEVFDIEESARGGGARVFPTDLNPLDAAIVVLALGNLPGEYPVRKSLRFYHGDRYSHVPWDAQATFGIDPTDDVLLVGQGLTAIDVILTLAAHNHRGVIHALSRRGLRPFVHRLGPAYPQFLDPAQAPRTILELLRRVRAEVRRAGETAIDWRAVLDSLRPITPALWQNLSLEERSRFLRHLRPFWEAHRHRLAPAIHEKLEALLAARRVRLHAGRVETFREEAGQVVVTARYRGTKELFTLRVARVINCTGPRSDYTKFQHPLFINLLSRGLIGHDPLALGIATGPDGSVLRYDGGAVGWMFTLGPPMKGVLWECTAVPEIRVQAASLAHRLMQATATNAAAAPPSRSTSL